ncbi:hypothetical protein [Gordonia sp. NPDC003376]
MAGLQSQLVGDGAFQIFGGEDAARLDELLADVFGRDDIAVLAADWRGIVYFTLADDEEAEPDTVIGFDASSGSSGPLATVDEVLAAVGDGDIAEAVDAESFAEWREVTGAPPLTLGQCVPPVMPEFLGGDPAERAVEATDLISHIASSATLMGRLEALGVAPGDEIPAEIFDAGHWE